MPDLEIRRTLLPISLAFDHRHRSHLPPAIGVMKTHAMGISRLMRDVVEDGNGGGEDSEEEGVDKGPESKPSDRAPVEQYTKPENKAKPNASVRSRPMEGSSAFIQAEDVIVVP
ncbi:hypothetical protein PSPO01_12741 [Paraphaeosphaeria sporulosa]